MTDNVGIKVDYDRILYHPIGVISTNEGVIEFISSFHEKSSNESSFIFSHQHCHFDAWDFIDGMATSSSLSKVFTWHQYVSEEYEAV